MRKEEWAVSTVFDEGRKNSFVDVCLREQKTKQKQKRLHCIQQWTIENLCWGIYVNLDSNILPVLKQIFWVDYFFFGVISTLRLILKLSMTSTSLYWNEACCKQYLEPLTGDEFSHSVTTVNETKGKGRGNIHSWPGGRNQSRAIQSRVKGNCQLNFKIKEHL